MKSAPSRPWSKKLQKITIYRFFGQIASKFEPHAQNELDFCFLQKVGHETLVRVP